jgi:hypothetical protein
MPIKKANRGFTGDVVTFWNDPDDYLPDSEQTAIGLRTSNSIQIRKKCVL